MATRYAWLIPLLLVACDGSRIETSGELIEDAEVVQVIYQPGQTASASGTSVDMELNVSFHSHTISSSDKFSVIFKCKHGKFIIEDEGKGSRAERLWKKLEKGDQVSVRYKEVMKVWPDGYRELQKYEFIDAHKIEKGGTDGPERR